MPEGSQRYTLSRVLVAELEAIKNDGSERKVTVQDRYGAMVSLRDAVEMEGERAEGNNEVRERERLRTVYFWAHQLRLSALCLSGGGIRSAAFSLGVIQALVDRDLLSKFNYLSTVSGGGYIGCWLSAWLYHTGNADDVLHRLGSRRSGSDRETPPLAHLREYSNYLTPKVGLFSADTWTALAIVLRNIAVNWLILVPALALVVIGVKLIALGLTWPADPLGFGWSAVGRAFVGAFASGCLIAGAMAFGYKLGRLYISPHSGMSEETRTSRAGIETPAEAQNRFLLGSLLPAALAGLFFVWLALQDTTPAVGLAQAILGQSWGASINLLLAILFFAFPVYILAILVGGLWRRWLGVPVFSHAHPFGLGWRDFLCWVVAVLVFAILVWLGASVIHLLPPRVLIYGQSCGADSGSCVAGATDQSQVFIRRESLVVVFGMPWFLMATMSAHFIYLLLRSASGNGEVEREWLGRASGWHFIAVLAWIMLSGIVLLGPAVYYNIPELINVLTAVAGTVTGLLGKSGLTPAKGPATDWKGFGANIALALAGPVFAVLLLILLSVIIDWPLVGIGQQCFPTNGDWDCHSWRWLIPIASAVVILVGANYFANINAFALHAVYRNRLIRAFLGGARAPHRHPEGFTDFDWDDDLRVASLWKRITPPAQPAPPAGANWRPFHVINMTLNLAATNRLAWQERKAMPFSVTPFFCGNAGLGYRPTDRYGGPHIPPAPNGEIRSGISLGTAMAISGAAVSSNMGYHSSMSLSFLLTFFNVRLGVWLGNPGQAGERLPWWHRLTRLHRPYETAGPQFAVRPLISELFGLTNDDSPYVYLSDGGHFEDFGLYEMVRRRCRWIVVCDGDKDAERGFGDLGNAVRKIWIDLGVRISFENSPLLAADKDATPVEVPYFALGTIEYLSDVLVGRDPPQGKILYIKPVVRGDEAAADVIAYKRAHSEFPQQPTTDQWFDESQFEAYRRLGQLMTERIIKLSEINEQSPTDLEALFDGLRNIDQTKMAKKDPVPNIC